MGLAHADSAKKKVAGYQIRQGLCCHLLTQSPVGYRFPYVLLGIFKIVQGLFGRIGAPGWRNRLLAIAPFGIPKGNLPLLADRHDVGPLSASRRAKVDDLLLRIELPDAICEFLLSSHGVAQMLLFWIVAEAGGWISHIGTQSHTGRRVPAIRSTVLSIGGWLTNVLHYVPAGVDSFFIDRFRLPSVS